MSPAKAGSERSGQFTPHEKIARPLTIKEIARPFALPITKIERRFVVYQQNAAAISRGKTFDF
jgi:hypothetical protein